MLSMLVALTSAPALLGTQEAIRQSQAKEKKEEHRARRCNLTAQCIKASVRSTEINGRQIVLLNKKLYIDAERDDGLPLGHPFAGYYLPYPEESFEGLVSTITEVAPILNWIYVDVNTHEVKCGVRADAQPHLHGPWDCTRQDRRLTFEGWEGFCVVEEQPGLWALYFDIDDNGLAGRVPRNLRILEIELTRVEKRWRKDPAIRAREQGTMQPGVEAEGLEQQSGAEAHGTSREETEQQIEAPPAYSKEDILKAQWRDTPFRVGPEERGHVQAAGLTVQDST